MGARPVTGEHVSRPPLDRRSEPLPPRRRSLSRPLPLGWLVVTAQNDFGRRTTRIAIEIAIECRFRPIADSDSDAKRTAIPTVADGS
jgi:hypothetical protein